MLRLYDLAGADPTLRFSPHCWRVKMALAHKELDVETLPWRFTDKAEIAFTGQKLVPVLVDDQRWIVDSWRIALYLDEAYPDRPTLFGNTAVRRLSRFYSCVGDALIGPIARFIALDILACLDPADKAYFRETREARFGMSLEALTADREARLPAFRDSLAPMRNVLKDQPYFAGDRPLYADYALFGLFQWARCVSPFALLAPDDPVARWRGRLLDAFDGLARSAPAHDA